MALQRSNAANKTASVAKILFTWQTQCDKRKLAGIFSSLFFLHYECPALSAFIDIF